MISKKEDRLKYHIDISCIMHRGKERLLLSFEYNSALIQRIKGIQGRRYTKTYKGWYLPCEVNSLIKLGELDIQFAIKESDKDHLVFHQYKEQIQDSLNSDTQSDSFTRKVGFLIDTFTISHRSLLKDYVHYLQSQGYSWIGIKYFTQFAMASLLGTEDDFRVRSNFDLEEREYKRVQEKFLEFRSQK